MDKREFRITVIGDGFTVFVRCHAPEYAEAQFRNEFHWHRDARLHIAEVR